MKAPTSSTIDWDHPCAGCQYNLRGLPTDGSCPECGKPVEQTFAMGWMPPRPTEVDRWMLVVAIAIVAAPVVFGIARAALPIPDAAVPEGLDKGARLVAVGASPAILICMALSRYARWSDFVFWWLVLALVLAATICFWPALGD